MSTFSVLREMTVQEGLAVHADWGVCSLIGKYEGWLAVR